MAGQMDDQGVDARSVQSLIEHVARISYRTKENDFEVGLHILIIIHISYSYTPLPFVCFGPDSLHVIVRWVVVDT